MSRSDEVAVVADDGADVEPALDDLQAAGATEMLTQSFDRWLVEYQPFSATTSRFRTEFQQKIDDQSAEWPASAASPGHGL